MRMFVGIVNFGVKNDQYLRIVLDAYRSMPWKTDILVLTNQPKQLGADVEVQVVEAPPNPRMFPMNLRRVLHERRAGYDVFVGTEDDVLLLPINAKAFLECAELMGPRDVPGFLRYEIGTGGPFVHDMHAHYWWNLDTAACFGSCAMAQPTNLHSATYMLTRAHLARAIDSGRFLNEHTRARGYGTLEAATTHLYLECGLRKWLPVERLDDFLLNHLPNTYVGKLGTPIDEVKIHAQALARVARGTLSRARVPLRATTLRTCQYDTQHYDRIRVELLRQVPAYAKRVLWIGSSNGLTERALVDQGAEVWCVPLDEIHAEALRRHGLVVLPPSLEVVDVPQFDLIVLPEILSRVPEPESLLKSLRPVLGDSGKVLAAEWNMDRHDPKVSWSESTSSDGDDSNFELFGLHRTSIQCVEQWFRAAGFVAKASTVEPFAGAIPALKTYLNRKNARTIVIAAA